jgi:superfamily II DNA or RNA helicase
MALLRVWPDAGEIANVCFAGLGKKNATARVVFASMQSIYKDRTALQWLERRRGQLSPIDLVIVDEAHLIPHKDVRERR